MNVTLKVRSYQDNIYEVIEFDNDYEDCQSLFQGSLSDCEAFIRLRNENYL